MADIAPTSPPPPDKKEMLGGDDDDDDEEEEKAEEVEEERHHHHKHKHGEHHHKKDKDKDKEKVSALSSGLGASIKFTPGESGQDLLTAIGGFHVYSEEEKRGIVEHLNRSLANDDLLKTGKFPYAHIPVDLEGDDIFSAIRDGVLLARFVNQLTDRPRISKIIAKPEMTIFEMNENNEKVITAAKRLGLTIVNIGAGDLTDFKPNAKHLPLGLMWQLVARDIRREISQMIKKFDPTPLMVNGEGIEQFQNMVPETILLRWFNYHLENAGHDRRVANFDTDVKDSINYLVLIHQIGKDHGCTLDGLKVDNPKERAECVLREAEKIDCRKFLTADDIVNGVTRLNFAFVANMFQKFPSLQLIAPPSPPPEPEPAVVVEPPKPEPIPEPAISVPVELPKAVVIPEDLAEKERDLLAKLALSDRREADKAVANAKNQYWDMKAELIDHKQFQELTKEKEERIAKELVVEQQRIEAEHQIRISELKKKLEKEKFKAAQRERYLNWTPEQFKHAIEVNQRHKEEMQKRIASLTDASADERQDLQMLEDENAELQGKLDRMTEDMAFEKTRTDKAKVRMENRVKEAQDDAEAAQQKLDEVQGTIQATSSEIMHLEQKQRELDEQHEDVAAQRKQSENLLKQLEEQIAQEEAKAAVTKLEHQKKVKQTLATERKAVKIQNEAHAVKQEAEHFKQQREELGQRADDLLDEINQQQVETSKATTEFEVANDLLDGAQEELDDALVEGELEVNRASKDAKNDVQAKKRQGEVQQKKDTLKTEALHDEALAAEKEAEALKQAKQEAQRAENDAAQELLNAKMENRVLIQQREKAQEEIEDMAGEMGDADKEAQEAEALHKQLLSENKTMTKLLQKAKKETDAATDELRQAERVTQTRKQEAETALGVAAEVERASNRLQLQRRDLKMDAKEAQAIYDEAEQEREEKLAEIEESKKKEEAKLKKATEQKIAKEKQKAAAISSDKTALAAQLEETEKQREALALAKAEALARQKAAETKIMEEKKKAEASLAKAADLDSVLKNAMGILADKQKTQESEGEKKAAAERRLRRAQKMDAERKIDKFGAAADKQKKSEIVALLESANATRAILQTKTKKDMALLENQHEAELEKVREEAEAERQRRIEAKKEEGRRMEEKLRKEIEEERAKSDRRAKALTQPAASGVAIDVPTAQ